MVIAECLTECASWLAADSFDSFSADVLYMLAALELGKACASHAIPEAAKSILPLRHADGLSGWQAWLGKHSRRKNPELQYLAASLAQVSCQVVVTQPSQI